MNFRSLCVIIACSFTSFCCCWAEEDQRAIEAGRDALGDTAWFDPQTDQLQSVPLATNESDELNRSSRWDPRPNKPAKSAVAPGAPKPTATGGPLSGFNFGALFGWTLLVVLIAAVTAIVVYAFISREPSLRAKMERATQSRDVEANLQDRLEQLPVHVEFSQGDLLSQARDLAGKGRFDLAIIYLFSQTLLQLDRRHCIRLSLGKTNRQYLRELRNTETLRTPTHEIVETFESSYFGGHTPNASRFSQCLDFYQRIESELRQTATTIGLLLCLTLSIGCRPSLDTTYGHTRGGTANHSINGYGALRQMYIAYGWEIKDDSRLSDRLSKAKALVWIPQTLTPGLGASTFTGPTAEQLNWFNNWLRADSGRTLIYIYPGYNAEADYFDLARQSANGAQKLEYRRRRAQLLTENAITHSNARSRSFSCDWFSVDEIPAHTALHVQGEFVDRPAPKLSVAAKANPATDAEIVGDFTLSSSTTLTTNTTSRPVPKRFTPEVIDSSGNTLVAMLSDDSWNDSKVFVVACPSFMVNLAFADPAKRPLVGELVNACGAPGRLVFLETNNLPIRTAGSGPPKPSGMELITKWPLNIVSVHLLAIGLITLIALFPIFGRSKRLQSASRTDFGRHLTAVAELLHRTGDVAMARLRISEYFEHVRDEPESPWVLPKQSNQPPTPLN